jgi:hypothetical protein
MKPSAVAQSRDIKAALRATTVCFMIAGEISFSIFVKNSYKLRASEREIIRLL